jgi:hypothetical protein
LRTELEAARSSNLLMRPAFRFLTAATVSLCLAGCGQSTSAPPAPVGSPGPPIWTPFKHVRGIVDLSAPGPDAAIALAARGHLLTLSGTGAVRGPAPTYTAPPGLEPYIVRSSTQRVAGAGCRFAAGAIYALRLRGGNGVTVIERSQRVRRFAALPSGGLENGIAFDLTGRFGHRLLVTTVNGGRTRVDAIDCRGRVRVLTRSAPRVEGGLAVAPRSFGPFGGDLIAPDELSGNVYAITPRGRALLVAQSGVPHGQDVGVESEGFVPARYGSALVADRGTARNRHPGDDAILRLPRAALTSAGVHAGDLLVVSEGGAVTIAVSCRRSCRARTVAYGPSRAHVEGHVVFSARP